MARVEYKEGVVCKKCGHMALPPFYNHLCQGCGDKIVHDSDIKIKNRVLNGSYTVTDNVLIATIKVTHKLFRDTYELVY